MADPVIPNVPSSLPADQAAFLKAMKASIEYIMGQGRTRDDDRALRVKELKNLGIDISSFLSSSASDHYVITQPTSSTGRVPLPPTNLVITKGAFVHTLTWDIPNDKIVWYIEIWAAENSQSRDDAELVGIYTVIDSLRGKQGLYKHSGFNVTNDYTYWIRSMSYGHKYSPWCPIDSQGGYIIVGDDSVQETVSKVLEILQGNISENQLYQTLRSRIDLIDTSGTGLIDRISTLETSIENIPVFDQNSTYSVDDVVKYDTGTGVRIYICIQDITTLPAHLPTDSLYWKQIGESSSLAGNVSANAAAISNLDTRVLVNEGNISSQAFLITGLRSDVDGNAADLVSEQMTRANADSSLASSITAGIATAKAYTQAWSEEGADVTENSAAFISEQIARADGDSANAEIINTVQTTVSGHTTAIETTLTSINGIQGKYSVKIDNNGYVTGFGLISTDNDGVPSSEFIILVDKFKIVTPGDSPRTPFVIGQVDGIDTVGIDGNLVVDGSIKSPAIEADAIKAAHIDSNEIFVGMTIQSSNFVPGSQGWKINQNGNMEIYGGTIVIGSGSSGFSNFSDAPTSLADINPGEYAILQNSIETHFYDGVPTLSNLPASGWTTDAVKDAHLGDMYYDGNTGTGYRFSKYSGVYSWEVITDSVAIEALALAQDAYDVATDHKRRIFLPGSDPLPPYDVGDLWTTGTEDGIKSCNTTRAAGASYVATDWVISATKGADWETNITNKPTLGALAGLDLITDTVITDHSISAQKINAINLAALSANLGNVYVDSALEVNSAGHINSTGKADYLSTTSGYFLGNYDGHPALNIGNATKYIKYRNGVLAVGGDIIATGNIRDAAVSSMVVVSTNTPKEIRGATDEMLLYGQITTTGKPVQIFGSTKISCSYLTSFYYSIEFRLYRGSTLIKAVSLQGTNSTGATYYWEPFIYYCDTVSAGTYAYSLWAFDFKNNNPVDYVMLNTQMPLVELKR